MALQLQEMLYHISKGDASLLDDLIRNNLVKNVIVYTQKRHKCKRKVLEHLVQSYTLRYYEFSEIFTEERYLNSIKKYLGRKVRQNSD